MDPEITDEAVAFTWAKALRTLRVSRRESLRGEPAFILAYQAALQKHAGGAARGWTPGDGAKPAPGPLLAGDRDGRRELWSAARAVDGMSKLHREVFSGPLMVDSEQLARMHALAGRLFAAAYA
ncbi:MAG TPA: hypothetical protein VFJ16_22690 [Longimicrobium sp.]|nr:hypothetical protein [Longimicrobium sp.]